jgi:dethiobiotin synthetase
MQRKQAFFITGTDTGIGKTFVTCALLTAAANRGLTAVGMKPVAAGVDANGQHGDVEQLVAASSIDAAPELINPYCFAKPIAPHLGAMEEGRTIDLDRIVGALRQLEAQADLVLVEGVGGFRVPLGETVDSADMAVRLGLPIIMVVGMRLGCLNHALLTADAINARGLTLAGWIANGIDPNMARSEENIAALQQRLSAPLLGILPWQYGGDPATAATYLSLP